MNELRVLYFYEKILILRYFFSYFIALAKTKFGRAHCLKIYYGGSMQELKGKPSHINSSI